MSEQSVMRRIGLGALAALLAMSFLALAPRADAATVVNGDFETGNLSGWSVQDFGDGSWFAYSGTTNPIEPEAPPVPLPPQGSFAAITAQDGPGTHVLYQDVALEAGAARTLSLIAYYRSEPPIFGGESLSYETSPNQQYRIDVIRPTAPLLTLAPEDILVTLLQTKTGDPNIMEPKTLTADLTPYGGQTVRLRFVEVDNAGPFFAGVDGVSISGPPAPAPAPPAPPAPPTAFTFGKLKLNKNNGTATLKVNVPGAGTLIAVDAKKKAPKRIRKAIATTAAAGVATLKLQATGTGKKALAEKGKLQFKALVSFTPTSGAAVTQPFKGRLVRLQG